MLATRDKLLSEFLADVWSGPGMRLVVTTREQHDEIAAGRESLYFDHGVIPPALHGPQRVVLVGICPELILEGTDWMDTNTLADYFEWWSARIKMRFIKQNALGETGAEDALVEDLVDLGMQEYEYPQTGWWQ